MLTTNTIRYGTDSFALTKTGLLIAQVPLDCTAFTSIDGFTTSGQQTAGTDRRVAFQVGGIWYKLTGVGVGTLTVLPTQALTVTSLLTEGNTVADLQAITAVAGFVGQKVTPAIALTAPGDGSTAYPTLQLGITGHSNQSLTSYTANSPVYIIANQDSTIINATANVTATNSGSVAVTASLLQAGVWSAFMPLTAVANQKASKIQFQATYLAPSIGTSTAQVNSVSVNYRTNNASVSGTLAELMSNTEVFPEGMSGVRFLVKHQKLFDAQLAAFVSFRPQPTQRTMIPIGTGTGVRQTLTLGLKDSNGNAVADTGINHNTLQINVGTSPAGSYDFNTATNQVSVTAPVGVTIFATYQCNWQAETWVSMVKGSTDTYNYEGNINSTEFTYQIPGQSAQGVSAVKVQLIKPGGTVTNASLGTATGSQQMIVLPHSAVSNTIVLTDGTNPVNSWSYDPNSRIFTFVATQGKNLVISYNWVAEVPVVTGFVAAWNQ